MKNVAVYTGTDFSPWKIPHKAQGIIVNNYAKKMKREIDFVINEGIFFENYSRLKNLLETRFVDELFFTSIFQLPKQDKLVEFLKIIEGKKIYFALEELYGESDYIENVIYKNLQQFRKAGYYNSKYEVMEFYKSI